MTSRRTITKPKDKKQTQEVAHTESDTETGTQNDPATSQIEDMVHILGPLLDQKLASIKESVSEILQQMTNQSQRLTQAEDKISTLEDNLTMAQSTIDLQQKEISIFPDKVEDLENLKTKDLDKLIHEWLSSALGIEDQYLPYLVERFHRIGPPPAKDAQRP
ncbi:hypothetical protein XELAEV_18029197mg [Xenopus laevis]|uniref:Uncharacterized protein n=1 Tax=Xenopus laevis TaxID=8355 RepID=A0A974HHE0_XENLA|nr:hypothetical protein XELAEV_18029197mg [Xenopus laevis]